MILKYNGDIEHLVELVHFISYGTGITYKDIYNWLNTPIEKENNRTAIECLEYDGRAFINRIKIHVNSLEDTIQAD